MTPLSTHVMDMARGTPVADVAVAFERLEAAKWSLIHSARTGVDGRVRLEGETSIEPGPYRLLFDTRPYFRDRKASFSYGEIAVCFEVIEPELSLHLPLLLAPYGYSTYRGS